MLVLEGRALGGPVLMGRPQEPGLQSSPRLDPRSPTRGLPSRS